jgi:undecaprenyl-diphosphatase
MGSLVEQLLRAPGWLALLLVFTLPALEASTLLGVVVPGELAVLLGGVLASQHRVNLGAVIAAAVAGAVCGDSAGYTVGRRFGPRLLAGRAGRLVRTEQRERGERFLRERGGAAIFLGRFTAALRALLPGLAGMAGMRYRAFALWNVAGGVVWGTAFVLVGAAAGSGWRAAERAAGRAGLLLAAAIVCVVLVVLAARWVAGHQERVRATGAWLAMWAPLARFRARYETQLDFLGRRLRPGQATGLALTCAFAGLAALAWVFGVLLQNVLSGTDTVLVDRPVLDWLVVHREPWLTSMMAVVTDLGAAWVLIPLCLLTGLVAWLRAGSRRPLGLLAAAYSGAWALSSLVKVTVGRPRPPLGLRAVAAGGLAFPSGHATQSIAVYGTLAVLASIAAVRWRVKVTLIAVLGLVVLAVGFSRAYLGVHWVTDVLGGWSLGGLWLLAILAATTIRRPDRRSSNRMELPPVDEVQHRSAA